MLVMSDYVIHVVLDAKHRKIYLPDSKNGENKTRSLNVRYVTSALEDLFINLCGITLF